MSNTTATKPEAFRLTNGEDTVTFTPNAAGTAVAIETVNHETFGESEGGAGRSTVAQTTAEARRTFSNLRAAGFGSI